MRKLVSLSFASTIALLMVFYVAYYLLLSDSFMHISVGEIIANAHQLSMKKHLLVLGLIPIYIGLMIFGTAILGMYLGSLLQSWINRTFKKPLKSNR